MKNKSDTQPTSIEQHITLLTFIANIIPSSLLVFFLWLFDVSNSLLGIAVFFLLLLSLYCVNGVWQKSQFQFRNLYNLLDALVQGDYSFRGLGQDHNSAYGGLVKTINALANTLQKQRLLSTESQLLVRKVVDQIDVAIIAWDQRKIIQLINPAAITLLGLSHKAALGETLLPQELNFTDNIKPGETLLKDLTFDNNRGKFRLHMECFIAEGNTHNLLFMTNVSTILRSQEKQSWQNLIRVLSHEINNSLAPLSSLSSTLKKQIQLREKDPVLAKELMDGISIIGNRANSLANFVQNYHQISKLPPANKALANLKRLIHNLIKLFPDDEINIVGDPIEFILDAAQIEQALINLIKNAIEANESFAAKYEKEVEPILITWTINPNKIVLQIIDNGEGIQNIENLFTPFYTTKKSGSGVGLVLCQQIIEGHEGYLLLSNRTNHHGCIATIELPKTIPLLP